MKAILSVVGKNNIGIVHAVSGVLVKYQLDILDISQTIMDDCFTMMCLLNVDESITDLSTVQDEMDQLVKEINVQIQL
ncbi:MAG: ACT domain-containing protein [Aerococcus sp.]|nr:ACT domain-containing protein [Aerococcus sp.]